MEALGFELESFETSDANPPEGLAQAQNDLEIAKIELETEKFNAKIQVVKDKAKGTGIKAKIQEVQKAFKDGKGAEAVGYLQTIAMAEGDNKIIIPIDLMNAAAKIAKAIDKVSA